MSSGILYRLVGGSAIVIASAASALADRTDFLVNDDGGSTEQSTPCVAVRADHSFAIVWVDKRLGGSDIFMQRFSTSAQPIQNNMLVNDNSAAYQFQVAAAADLSGYLSVVWNDYRNGLYPFDPDIFYQRFDPSGARTGANLELTTELPDTTKETPDISLSTWGTGVVVWADRRLGNWDIYGQLIDSDGDLIGSNFRVNDDAGSAQQHAPKVSTSADGWFVVTWYDNRAGNDDIFVQRFDSLGRALGSHFKVNSDAGTNRQAFPDVATDGAGHFTVVWVDWRNGIYPANSDIYACRFDTLYTTTTGNFRVNRDNTERAQREVAIAADRMGNVGIIWSDSNTASWDIVGQMIDVDGVVREANFTANSHTDSAHLKPDIALDGNYRYITWADRRNGNLDIYASVTRYNDPSLIVQPNLLRFTMAAGGAAPAPQTLSVQHVGYNRLPFRASSYNSWIGFDPVVGTTPDSLSVFIADTTLAHGSYFGALTITDTLSQDSVVIVNVRLDVTSPILTLSKDTLDFTAPAGVDYPQAQSLAVTNAENGDFAWSAASSAVWLTVAPDSGMTPATVNAKVNAVGLSVGRHTALLVVSAPGAVGSPDTVLVRLDVVDSLPFIAAAPESVFVSASNLASANTFVVVSNLGGGELNWTVSDDASWLTVTPSSGHAGDTIALSISDALPTGLFSGAVTITDLSAANGSVRVPIVVDYVRIAIDTLTLGSGVVAPAGRISMPVDLRLLNAASEIVLPPRFDPSLLHADSAVFGSALPLLMDKQSQISQTAGTIILQTERLVTDTFLVAGNYRLAVVHFTAANTIDIAGVDTTTAGGLRPLVTTPNGSEYTPVVKPALISIGDPATLVDTVLLEPANTLPGDPAVVPVYLHLEHAARAVSLPLRYAPALVTADSVRFGPGLPVGVTKDYEIRPGEGTISVSLSWPMADSLLLRGDYLLAELHFTAGDSSSTAVVDTVGDSAASLFVADAFGNHWTPVVIPAAVEIGSATDVPPDPNDLLPDRFALGQNFPNPFNASTVIEFTVPRASYVTLSIYNILGQQVAALVDRPLSRGGYTVIWDGLTDRGSDVPSGVYFYRLSTGGQSQVRKMVMLR